MIMAPAIENSTLFVLAKEGISSQFAGKMYVTKKLAKHNSTTTVIAVTKTAEHRKPAIFLLIGTRLCYFFNFDSRIARSCTRFLIFSSCLLTMAVNEMQIISKKKMPHNNKKLDGFSNPSKTDNLKSGSG